MAILEDGQYFTQAKVSPAVVVADADLTQVITVTTAGTPVQGPAKSNPSGWYIKAATANTGIMYFMFHGQTAAAKGFPLSAGQLFVIPVTNLSDIDFDASVNGEKIIAAKV